MEEEEQMGSGQLLAITASQGLQPSDRPWFAPIMLRQAARGFCRRSLVARGIRTTAIARQDEEALPKAFTERFVKQVPSTMAPPNFPTDFMSKEAKQVNEAPSTVPDKLTFNFYLPHEQIAKAKKVSHAAYACETVLPCGDVDNFTNVCKSKLNCCCT